MRRYRVHKTDKSVYSVLYAVRWQKSRFIVTYLTATQLYRCTCRKKTDCIHVTVVQEFRRRDMVHNT